MTTTDRLLAAQSARAAAKRAFHSVFSAAVREAIARGLRIPEEIDAAAESDPAVIAARTASQTAITELKAAQAAMKADATVSDEDHAYVQERRAVEMARIMTESASVSSPAEIAQHEQDEEDGIERSAPVAMKLRASRGPTTFAPTFAVERLHVVRGVETIHATLGRIDASVRWTTEGAARDAAREELKLIVASDILHSRTLEAHGDVARITDRVTIGYRVVRHDDPWSAEPTLPAGLAWCSVDGDEAVLVGELHGRRVVAVRRRFGAMSERSYGTFQVAGIATYWTSIIESSPGSARPMAYISKRFFEPMHDAAIDRAMRGACIRAAQAQIKADERDAAD